MQSRRKLERAIELQKELDKTEAIDYSEYKQKYTYKNPINTQSNWLDMVKSPWFYGPLIFFLTLGFAYLFIDFSPRGGGGLPPSNPPVPIPSTSNLSNNFQSSLDQSITPGSSQNV